MPGAGLTTGRAVEEAGKVADDCGLANLTLTALASRLGVRKPSLYEHVAGLAALQRLVSARADAELAGVLARAATGKAREEAVAAISGRRASWSVRRGCPCSRQRSSWHRPDRAGRIPPRRGTRASRGPARVRQPRTWASGRHRPELRLPRRCPRPSVQHLAARHSRSAVLTAFQNEGERHEHYDQHHG